MVYLDNESYIDCTRKGREWHMRNNGANIRYTKYIRTTVEIGVEAVSRGEVTWQ